MSRINTFLLIVFVVLFQSISAFERIENFTPKFIQINQKDGLIQNSVTSIIQDSTGFMWIGTPNGLYKHDGFSFIPFKHSKSDSSSICSNNIQCLFVDNKGLIWVGTLSGLSIYNPETMSFYNPNNISKNLSVFSIVQASNGLYFMGTSMGLFIVKSVNDNLEILNIVSRNPDIVKYKGLPDNRVNAMCFDNDSALWIGTSRGIAVFNYKKFLAGEIIFEHLNEKDQSFELVNNTNVNFIEIYKNRKYIGTSNGGYVINEEVDKIDFSKKMKDSFVLKSIEIENDSVIWLGTLKNGLIRYNINKGIPINYKHNDLDKTSISSNQVNAIFKDESNVMWLGCGRGGLSKLYLKQKNFNNFQHVPNDLNTISSNNINAVYEDINKNIWIATYDNVLEVIKNEGNKVLLLKSLLPELEGKRIFSILFDEYQNLWLGSNNHGVYLIKNDQVKRLIRGFKPRITNFYKVTINGKKEKITNVSEIVQSKRGIIWLGSMSGGGLVRFDINESIDNPELTIFKNDPFNSNSLNSNNISAIYKDQNGYLWIGTKDKGATRITLDQNDYPKNVERFSEGIFSNDRVFSFVEDDYKNIWVATFGGGICILKNGEIDKSETIYINDLNGLADNSIYGMLKDKQGNVWLSTDVGISRINAKTFEIRNFNEADGIPNGNFRRNAYHQSSSGNFYFGGISGVVIFNPELIIADLTKPKAVITDFQIQDHRIIPNKIHNNRIVLSQSIFLNKEKVKILPSERSFSFLFASTHYAYPKQNIFEYKMVGLYDDWRKVERGINKVTFSNLSPGNYSFYVRTTSPDGIVSVNNPKASIYIKPPFYLSIYAYIIYVVLVLGVFWIYRRVIIMRQQFANNLMIEQLEKEKIEEINKNKLTFFTNISHEFKTPLTLILGPIDKILSMGKMDRPIVENLNIIRSNANRLLRLVNQLMEFRKIESGHIEFTSEKFDLIFFLKALLDSFAGLASKRNIQVDFESNEKFLSLNLDIDKIEKIFSNLITNAIKYTPEGGNVKIKVFIDRNGTFGKDSKDVKIIDNNLKESVVVSVEDTGVGIDLSEIDKIFDRFYQSEMSDNRIQVGTGIGLSLVKNFVGLHNGEIIVNSTVGVGSDFIIKLPYFKDVDLQEEDSSVNAVSKIIQDVKDSQGFEWEELPGFFNDFKNNERPLILVADDNEEIRQFLVKSLEKYFEVIEAADGEEAYKLALEKIPELVISDVMMPIMDGLEMTINLKENILTNHIPVVLLTAKGAIEHRIEGIKKGADSYIPKPFKLEHLFARIEQLLMVRKTLREKYQDNNSLPQEKKNRTYLASEMAFLKEVEQIIEENLTNNEFTVNDLEEKLCLSRMQLYRKLKTLVGIAGNEFIRDYRLRRAAVFFSEGDLSVSEVIYKTGFSNHSYFTRSFKKKYEISPKEFAKKYTK